MFYNLAIYLYLLGVIILSLFNKKVRKMWQGEKRAFDVLREQVEPGARYLWFHAASLGEFEQGRPLMERIRERHPEYKILLTFFSPSGYEVRKNYPGADIICYLPLDTPLNAVRFLRLARPVMAFFIKYEFWYNYLHLLRQQGVPTYSVSSIFRPSQVFFKWYGMGYGNVLRCVTRFFVQNEESRQLLRSIHIDAVDVVGDTRFDRVLTIKQAAKRLPLVEAFVGDAPQVFVAGSSWPPDEDIFIRFFNSHPEWKLIIAPHVIAAMLSLRSICARYFPSSIARQCAIRRPRQRRRPRRIVSSSTALACFPLSIIMATWPMWVVALAWVSITRWRLRYGMFRSYLAPTIVSSWRRKACWLLVEASR